MLNNNFFWYIYHRLNKQNKIHNFWKSTQLTMHFTRSQHKSIKGNTWKKVDPPGSGAPGRRQVGPGGQTPGRGADLDLPRTWPGRAHDAASTRGRVRRGVAAADRRRRGRGVNGPG
jgi:hypothetical protein